MRCFSFTYELGSFKAFMSISAPNGLGTEKGWAASDLVVQLRLDTSLPASGYKARAIAFHRRIDDETRSTGDKFRTSLSTSRNSGSQGSISRRG